MNGENRMDGQTSEVKAGRASVLRELRMSMWEEEKQAAYVREIGPACLGPLMMSVIFRLAQIQSYVSVPWRHSLSP